jgi:hypothetical protein
VRNQQVQNQPVCRRQCKNNTKFSESAGAKIIKCKTNACQVQISERDPSRASGKTTEISRVVGAKIIKWKTNVCQVQIFTRKQLPEPITAKRPHKFLICSSLPFGV